jgi:hypothetical protein
VFKAQLLEFDRLMPSHRAAGNGCRVPFTRTSDLVQRLQMRGASSRSKVRRPS